MSEGTGGGEDTDASVARILRTLESDPNFAGVSGNTSEKRVFNAAKAASGGTLYALWQEITSGADRDTVNRLAKIFEKQNVAPTPAVRTPNAGATFTFYLPVTNPGNAKIAPFIFDTLTLQVFGYMGDENNL